MRKFVAGLAVALTLSLAGCFDQKPTKWEYASFEVAPSIDGFSWSAGGKRYTAADSKGLVAELEKAGVVRPTGTASVLDAIGDQGWELVTTTTRTEGDDKFVVWQFKRPKA